VRIAVSVVLLSSAMSFADASAPQTLATFDDSGTPKIILTSMAQGATFLVVGIYEHGRVAYVPPGDYSRENFLTVTLTPTEESELLAGLALDRIGHLNPPERIGSDGATDCIHVWRNGEHAKDCIWGGMEDDAWAPSENQTPPEMTRIWKRLAHFSSARAQRWLPSRLRVEISAAGGRPCPPHAQERWPATWPIPDGPTMRRLTHGTMWTITLPTTELRTLQRLAGWSSPTPTGCDQGVFVRDLLVDVIYRSPMPPYPRR
jgi:hypothetical protein